MATVPVYGGQQVRSEALRPVFQDTPDVSSGSRALAQGIDQAGVAIDRIVEREQRAALVDAKAKADMVDATISTEWLKWDAENRNKYRGQNVDGYAPAAQEWWKNAAERFGKDLDPRVKQLASSSLVRKQGSALADVTRFVGVEKERHADEAASASIVSTIQFGVTTGDVAGAADQVRGQVAAIGARKGWTTEQVQAEQLKNLSALHLAQITKLADKDPAAASAYYQANKGEVLASNQPKVEEVLRNEGNNQFATQFAAQVAPLPLAEQLKKAGEIADPERREKALTQVKLNHAMVREAQREKEEQASDAAWQMFAKGQKIPETVLAGMNGRERAQLQEAGRARADRLAAGKTVKTDMSAYIDLRERLARGEKVDLRGYTEKIGKGEMEQLLDIQTKRNSPDKNQQDSIITDHQRVEMALDGLGIDRKKHPEDAGRIINEIDRRVRAASAAKGDKPLTPEEKQKAVDSVILDKVYVIEWGRDPQKPTVMLTPEEQAKAYVSVNGRNVLLSSVPATDRRQIAEALRRVGQIPTEQAIVQMYVDAKQRKGAK